MKMEQTTDTQLQQVVNMLARRWQLILSIGAIGAVLAGIVGLLIPPRYTAKAQIVIDSYQVSTGGGYRSRAQPVNKLAIETQVAMLASRNHLQRVRDSLAGIADLPAAKRAQADRKTSSKAVKGKILGLHELRQGLKVFQERQSRVIAVTFTSMNPERAAEVANRFASLHVTTQADRKRAEKNSARFEQEVADLNKQLFVAKSDVGQKQARLTALRDLQRRGGTNELIEALDSPVLTEIRRTQIKLRQSQAELATTFSDAHPKVQTVTAKLKELRQTSDREVDRIVNQLESETRIAGTRVRSLQQLLSTMQVARRGAQEPGLSSLPPQGEAAESAPLNDNPLNPLRPELSVFPEISPGMRILTVAETPRKPSSPSPILFIFPALVVSTIAGGLMAAVLEGLDQGLRSERDIREALGIPSMGFVPELRGRKIRRMHEYLLQNPFAPYTEAIRSAVIAALQLTAPTPRPPKVFLITSSVPREGKTTLAVSFAVYAAHIKRRVLLVDLAFRNPSIQRELECTTETGILDVLQGQPLNEAIQNIPELSLDYLALPDHPVDPLALLGSNKMPELLRQLRESYDCVVIDSSPLLGTTEARMLVSMVDKVLFAVKWGSTRRQIAQNALNLLRSPGVLERDPTNLTSAIVTQVDLKKHATYRDGDVAEVLAQNKSYYSRTDS